MNSKRLYLAVLCVFTLVIAVVISFGPLFQDQDEDGYGDLGGAALAARSKGGDPDGGGERAVAGNRGEAERQPGSLAEAQYANRAFPATEISIQSKQNSINTFQKIKAKPKKKDTGTWQLIGPEKANYPGVLSFSGAPYTASGRITALAIAPSCEKNRCRLYVGAAGGGVWRTDKALGGSGWTYLSESFGTNAIGTIVLDPNDSRGDTLYAGTGEPNASGDSESGVGIYKSTDGGDSWALLPGSAQFFGRAISYMVIDPTDSNVIYAGVARAVRGISSVTGGATSNPPVAVPLGLYRSTNGGNTFTSIWDGNGSVRGVIDVGLDPLDHNTVYASAFQQGIWRSSLLRDGSTTFKQIFATTSPGQNTARTMFALTVKNAKTRIYAGDGSVGGGDGGTFSQFWRVDDANISAAALLATQAAAGGWEMKTSPVNGDPYYATFNYCTGQCWYDNDVYTPAGFPDIVYLIGSFQYGELGGRSNARAVLLSTTAGDADPANGDRTFTDMTWDATPVSRPDGIHPDQHEIVTKPGDPFVFFSGSDGGLMRSDGKFEDVTGQCATRPIGVASMATCKRLLSRVPHELTSLNDGLSTLQFQSLSVNPHRPLKNLMGGTQDNGTFEFGGSTSVWPQIIYGDGGQSGFDAANPDMIRFNTFFDRYTDSNFRGGDPLYWVVISGPLFVECPTVTDPHALCEDSAFYKPIIADPVTGGTMYTALNHVWRTKDNGGNQAFLEANCPEFTTPGDKPTCGDWVPLGGAAGHNNSGDISGSFYGATRVGGVGAATERTKADTRTLWAATSRGRVFVSKNADAEPAADVTFTRIDTLAPSLPGRFVSSIYVDNANANHAWISYSGYNFNTPTQFGHVFEVTYNPTAGTATAIDRTYDLADLPVTDLVRDDVTGDLYASTDFGVMRLPSGSTTWGLGGDGLPMVEVAGLTIDPSARVLYAATHGRGAWRLMLPGKNEKE